MPPRKRARLSQAVSPSAQATTPEPPNAPKSDADILEDPWTDEEEIGLFKALIKWKPTGIHKHFRMLQLREYLLDNSYIHHKSEHTQIPGIWQKLASLYDLEALDQREDARQLSDLSDEEEDDEDEEMADDAFSMAENKIHKQSFELPDEEYGEQMWRQRLAGAKEQRDESPPTMPELNLIDKAPVKFTPSFSIEPEEVPTARGRGGRQSRGGPRAKATATGRRSTRKGGSVTAESEEAGSEEEQADSQAGSEEGEEEEEEEGDEEASETSAPARGRGRPRGRGTTKGRPRGRRR